MRRLIVLTVAAAALVPLGARAEHAEKYHDVPDGRDCRRKAQVTATTAANGATETDRLAICVNQGGMTVLYFGGEMQSEDRRNDGFATTCGAIIVANQPVASGNMGEDWDHSDHHGSDPKNDGFRC